MCGQLRMCIGGKPLQLHNGALDLSLTGTHHPDVRGDTDKVGMPADPPFDRFAGAAIVVKSDKNMVKKDLDMSDSILQCYTRGCWLSRAFIPPCNLAAWRSITLGPGVQHREPEP